MMNSFIESSDAGRSMLLECCCSIAVVCSKFSTVIGVEYVYLECSAE